MSKAVGAVPTGELHHCPPFQSDGLISLHLTPGDLLFLDHRLFWAVSEKRKSSVSY
jgi:hypothetical protein